MCCLSIDWARRESRMFFSSVQQRLFQCTILTWFKRLPWVKSINFRILSTFFNRIQSSFFLFCLQISAVFASTVSYRSRTRRYGGALIFSTKSLTVKALKQQNYRCVTIRTVNIRIKQRSTSERDLQVDGLLILIPNILWGHGHFAEEAFRQVS